MTSLGYYPYWDDDDWSGYTPPDSGLLRHVGDIEGLPAPVYESGPAVGDIDWAGIIVDLAIERYGGDNGSWCATGPTNRCDCGVTWVGEAPCWNCYPQPGPKLIVPGGSDRALP